MAAASEQEIRSIPLAHLYPVTIAQAIKSGASKDEAMYAVLKAHSDATGGRGGEPLAGRQTQVQQHDAAEAQRKMHHNTTLMRIRIREAAAAGQKIDGAQAYDELHAEGKILE